MRFNNLQQQALDSKKSLIISAGAGSGKTAVLSKKVYDIINNNEVKPSNLLVLTFTDKAATQMKEKIIKMFEDNNDPKATDMASAHIQTFDSFSSFLVKKYSYRLKINPNFVIVSDAIIEAKTNEILDNILFSLYQNKDENIKRLLNHYAFRDDSNIKNIILAIKHKIDTFDSLTKDKFLNHYEENYLNRDALLKDFNDYVTINYLNIMKTKYDTLDDYVKDLSNYTTEASKKYFEDLENILVSDVDTALTLVIDIKSKPQARTLKNAYGSFQNIDENIDKINEINENLKDLKEFAKTYTDSITQLDFINSFKEDINFFLTIVKELNYKLDEFKNNNSCYTFSDVTSLCIKLFKESEFIDIKKELIDTYKFILVDEYQDTNDIQEDLINALTKDTSNKLFLVGDMKQSIYKFRYSNPILFLNRRKYFKDNPKIYDAIDMNINYRSVKEILDIINKYCEKNMNIDNGGLVFESGEKLIFENGYASSLSYNKENKGFNILYSEATNIKANTDAENDAYLIANDILNKIKNHYQVIDEDNKGNLSERDATFKDFAILARRKYNFSVYQRIFEEKKIPLSVNYDEASRNTDVVIILENLIKLYYSLMDENNKDKVKNRKHLFYSLGRSYLYSYSDQYLYDKVSDNSYENDEIFLKMKEFINESKDYNLKDVVVGLINNFGVLSKINKIGNYFNNFNLIEFINNLSIESENNGEGIEGFIKLLDNFDKYNIEIKQESIFYSSNSVELTTMHKSKGLEYKIIYIPLMESNFTERDRNDSDGFIKAIIDKEKGIVLPHQELDKEPFSYLLKEIKEKESFEDNNEAERLIYVALTRAKEAIYFVSPHFKYDIKDNYDYKKLWSKSKIESELFNAFSFHFELDETYLSLLKKLNVINDDFIKELKKYVELANLYIKKDELLKATKLFNEVNFDTLTIKAEELNKNTLLAAKDKLKTIKKDDLNDFSSTYLKDLHYGSEETINKFLSFLMNLEQIFNYYIIQYFIKSNYGLIEEKIKYLNYLDKDFIIKNNLRNLFNELKRYQNGSDSFVVTKKILKTKNMLDFIHVYLRDKVNLSNGLFLIKFNDIYTDVVSYDNDIESIEESSENILKDLSSLNIKDEDLHIFKERKYKRASKTIESSEKYNEDLLAAMEYGTHMHFMLENFNFKNPDYSYIDNLNERKRIENIRNSILLNDINEKTLIYKEYQYELNNILGSIDLLLIYPDKNLIKIIDYKSSHIDDPAYINQLNQYKDSINIILNKDNKYEVKMYLLSIKTGEVNEVIDNNLSPYIKN